MPTPPTSALTVLTFPTTDGAASALRTLEGAQRRRQVTVEDCAVVEWAARGSRPVAYQVGTAEGATALAGAFWGLRFGSLFLAPLAGLTGPVWPPDGLSRIGLPESLLAQVREKTRPGTSALFVLCAVTETAHVRELLDEGEPLAVEIGAEQDAALRRAFGREKTR